MLKLKDIAINKWSTLNFVCSILIAIFAIAHIGVGAGFWGQDSQSEVVKSSTSMLYAGFVEFIFALTIFPPLSNWVKKHTRVHGLIALLVLNISCLITLFSI